MKNGFFVAAIVSSLLVAAGCADTNSSFWNFGKKKKDASSQPAAPVDRHPEQVPAEPVYTQAGDGADSSADESTASAVRDYIDDLEQANSTDGGNEAAIAEREASQPDSGYGPQPVHTNEAVEMPRDGANPPQPVASGPKKPHVLAVSLGGDTSLATESQQAPTVGMNRGMDVSSGGSGTNLDQIIEQAKADVEQDPTDARKQWRLSLLQLAADKPADAARLSDGLSPDARRLTTHIVRTVTNASKLLDDPLAGADRTLAALDAFRASLREEAELLVPVVALCSRVTTFGVYDPLPEGSLKPYQANRAIVYCEVDNFTTEEAGNEGYRSLLATRIELFTDDGKSVWSHEEERIEDTSQQRREDFFLAQLVTLPADLGPGDYVLKVAVTDVLSSKTNEGVHRFHIGGIDATTSASR